MSILPDWLTGYDAENAARAAAADAELRRLAEQRGQIVAPDSFDFTSPDAQRQQIDQTFTDTLDSRAKSLIGNPLAVVWSTIAAILKAIPLWVWIVAALFAFYWLGGFTWAARKTKGALL